MDDRRVIVIGSGPSGAMMAHELVRRGIPVTMLESGLELQKGLLVRIMGKNLFRRVPGAEKHTSPGPRQTAPVWWQNLSPGGLTNQWTGAVPRFAPEDFTEGERLHEKYRWPVSYAELEPYYEAAECLIGVNGNGRDVPNLPAGRIAYSRELPRDWQEIARFAEANGQGLTLLPMADGPPSLIVRRGAAFNSFTNIVQPLIRSPLFQLQTGAHALRLEWSPSRRKVESVVYFDRRAGAEARMKGAAVAVACGALQSAKLLFDSACADFPQGLGNSEGLLGLYLHDHPRDWWMFEAERPLTLLSSSGYLTRRPYESSPPLLATSWTMGTVTLRDRMLSRVPLKGNSIGVQVFGTMIPTEQCFVAVADKRMDEFGLPLLEIHLSFEEEVVQNMAKSREGFVSLMSAAGYRGELIAEEARLIPGASVHYGGTIRMHASRRYGMADAWNRLYDAPNVLVCDASCFTTGPEKNPTLTVMALAARAADRLAHDLKSA
jgi:choline dehydrogenase-like flavoprotein